MGCHPDKAVWHGLKLSPVMEHHETPGLLHCSQRRVAVDASTVFHFLVSRRRKREIGRKQDYILVRYIENTHLLANTDTVPQMPSFLSQDEYL